MTPQLSKQPPCLIRNFGKMPAAIDPDLSNIRQVHDQVVN